MDYGARVILLAGPSGSGKSTLARASGLPLLELDHFYRNGDDPDMPCHPTLGIVDWDHPDAWNTEAAVAAILRLCHEGSTEVPVYDISTDRIVATSVLRLDGHHRFIAEGIFAPDLVARLSREGVLADAIVVHRRPWKNFARRLLRDISESRKPLGTLVRRGRNLWRAEPQWMQRCIDSGCRPLNAKQTRRVLADAARL